MSALGKQKQKHQVVARLHPTNWEAGGVRSVNVQVIASGAGWNTATHKP